MISSILGFLLVISIIVTVHEYGHYLAARICGVKVITFSVGFGKKLMSYVDKKGTEWCVSLIPLGGYVKMYGEKDLLTGNFSSMSKHDSFASKTPIQRGFIAFAGPFTNFVLAFVILAGLYSYSGKYLSSNEISDVVENSPASAAGLQQGDRIVEIGGTQIEYFEDIYNVVSMKAGELLRLKVISKGEMKELSIRLGSREIKDENGKILGSIGILGVKSGKAERYELDLLSATYFAVKDISAISKMTFQGIGQIILGSRSTDDLRGAITIAKESGNSFSGGLGHFLVFLAVISVNIGLVNLLPIPILDGGHIILCVYEIIAGKMPSKKILNYLTQIGLIIIIFMFVISTSNDIKFLLF